MVQSTLQPPAPKRSGNKTKTVADDRDQIIGQRLRARRNLLKMSQKKLAEAIGLTFQQVQKYELGINKISAVRLMDFCKTLDVSISYFYAGLADIGEKTPASLRVSETAQATLEDDPMLRKETLDLVRAYYQIEDPKIRQNMLKLVKSMASEAE